MSNNTAPDGYLTAKQARDMIGVTQGMFYNFIRHGQIKPVVFPGKQHGFYPEIEIRRFAREYQAALTRYQKATLYFGIALPEDIPDIRALLLASTGRESHTLPAEIIAGWMRRNPQAQHVLRRGSHIIGYIAAFPLAEDAMYKRMTGEYWNRTLPMEEVQPFLPDSHINLYIAEAVIDQALSDKAILGFRLLHFMLSFLMDLARDEQIIVDALYAVGTSHFGIDLCRKLHMEVLDVPVGVRDDRLPCRTIVAANTSRLLARYRKAVQEE